MSKPKKRFGGLSGGSANDPAAQSTLVLIRGIRGCLIGLEMARQDMADDDHQVMLDRIGELCDELMARVEHEK